MVLRREGCRRKKRRRRKEIEVEERLTERWMRDREIGGKGVEGR